MNKYMIAGVDRIMMFDSDNNMTVYSDTLQKVDEKISVSEEELRGGLGDVLLAKYFHGSKMEFTITDAVFNLNYMALHVGGNITVGGDSIVDETVTTTVANQITVTGTPVAFGDAVVGWYTLQGASNWQPITFTGKNASVSNLPIGSVVCVKYNSYNDALSQFVVPSSIIPSIQHLVLRVPLFSADATVFTSNSRVGSLIVDVPRYQLNGEYDLSMSSSGVAENDLSGSALKYTESATCDNAGQYAIVKTQIDGNTWVTGLTSMAVNSGADIHLTVGETETLSIIGFYDDGKHTTALNSNLTFTSDTPATATVSNAGVITAVAAGTSQIKVVATATSGWTNPVECYAEVTVTA